MYVIKNNFHGTEARTKYSPKKREDIELRMLGDKITLTEKQAMRRAKRKLCGIRNCTCSNGWGERS